MLTGKWSWALIPYPILPPSLISHTVSVAVKHHKRRTPMTAQRPEKLVLGSRNWMDCLAAESFSTVVSVDTVVVTVFPAMVET